MVEFNTRQDIEDWLKTQPRSVVSIIAVRAALRALPAFASLNVPSVSFRNKASTLILPSLYGMAEAMTSCGWSHQIEDVLGRARLVDSIGVDNRSIQAITLAHYASSANARDVTHDHNVAFSRTISITFAAIKLSQEMIGDALAVVTADVNYIKSIKSNQSRETWSTLLSVRPLWQDINMPNELKQDWKQLKIALHNLNEDWEVWTSWYENILAGGERNEDLEIARISFPPEDYTNAAVLNPKIKALLINKLSEATPLAEKVYLNEEGKFDVEFLPVRALYAENLKRLEDAIRKCVRTNALTETSDEIIFLQDIINLHADNPQRIFDDCRFAQTTLQDLVNKHIIDDSFAVKRLINSVQLTADDIQANEADVRDTLKSRSTLHINTDVTVNHINQKDIHKHQKPIEDITSERLGSELKQDGIDFLTLPFGKDKAQAIYRLASRYSRMYIQIHNDSGGITLDGARLALIHAQPHLEAMINILRNFLPGY